MLLMLSLSVMGLIEEAGRRSGVLPWEEGIALVVEWHAAALLSLSSPSCGCVVSQVVQGIQPLLRSHKVFARRTPITFR
jgi:hypothetical protein